MIYPVRPLFWKCLLAAALAAFGLAAAAQDGATNAPSGKDFAYYKVIAERNIFDPRRSGRSGSGGGRERRPRRTETFTLVGTLFSEKGPVAFFDGSGAEFKKAVHKDGKIANFNVVQISPSSVTLMSGTNKMNLRVTMGARREEDGEWQTSGGPAVASAARTDSDSSSSSDSGSDGEVNDVLKRLMQQREQESK